MQILNGLGGENNLDIHRSQYNISWPPRAKVLKTVFLSAPPDFLVYAVRHQVWHAKWFNQMAFLDGFQV